MFRSIEKTKEAWYRFISVSYTHLPNHTLPTSGTARFMSPLSVDDFVKRTQFTYYTKEALGKVRSSIARFARQEGLEAHARSALSRFEEE